MEMLPSQTSVASLSFGHPYILEVNKVVAWAVASAFASAACIPGVSTEVVEAFVASQASDPPCILEENMVVAQVASVAFASAACNQGAYTRIVEASSQVGAVTMALAYLPCNSWENSLTTHTLENMGLDISDFSAHFAVQVGQVEVRGLYLNTSNIKTR